MFRATSRNLTIFSILLALITIATNTALAQSVAYPATASARYARG